MSAKRRAWVSLGVLAWRDLRSSGRHLRIFWACLMLGVSLVAATGGLHRLVESGLLTDSRALFGGDLEVGTRAPLDPAVLHWMRERAEVSLLIELRTMMLARGQPQLVELQSVDERYPLYGAVRLDPPQDLARAVEPRGGVFGAAIDPVLARRLDLRVGDRVSIGNLEVEVRALIERQPDRSLSADWRGAPVIVAGTALAPSGLIGPGSRLDYEYRVKIDTGSSADADSAAWAEDLARAFPGEEFEVHTFASRRERMARVLGQITSGLLLVGFSALFVGGLGVFNSVRAYLDTKLATIATLRAVGLRDRRLAVLYLGQVLALAGSAALAGVVAGGVLATIAAGMVAEGMPVTADAHRLLVPLGAAWLFGVLTALAFAVPAIGRALSVRPATLFRGIDASTAATPRRWWWGAGALALAVVALVAVALPQPAFGIGFIVVAVSMLGLLELVVRGLRAAARRIGEHPALDRHFGLKLAVAGVHRPGSPLRVTLLSLGSALTVLVASAIVVASLLEMIDETIPESAPALVFYDIAADQRDELRRLAESSPALERVVLAPLVLGRISHVNAEALGSSADAARALESRDEHKLTHRLDNIDEVIATRGSWWAPDYAGPPLVAFEDREADQLGLSVGDRVRFRILGEDVEAEIAVIYAQRGIGTRFWFEGMFSAGVLDPFVTRYVGTAYLDHAAAIELESRIARAMPNVVVVRTERILREAGAMLARAASGLAVIAGVMFAASLLVLASATAASRARQLYDATVLHVLGARLGAIRSSLSLEYLLVALLTSLFAVGLGSAIAAAVLRARVRIEIEGVWWVGVVVAAVVSVASLGLGAVTLLRRLRLSPATLLRTSG